MIRVQGFNFHDSSVASWVLEKCHENVRSLGQLLQRFYDDFSADELHPFQPISWVRDPEKEGQRIFGSSPHIVAVYRRGYYIVIEKCHGELFGPHAARLMFRPRSDCAPFWIAILQISANFALDTAMREPLALAIELHEFYQSPATAETIVEY